MIIDSHIHLSHGLYRGEFPFLAPEGDRYTVCSGSRGQLIRAMRDAGVAACVEPAVEIDSNRELLALAARYPGFLFPAVGVHPTRTFAYRVYEKNGSVTERRLPWKRRGELAEWAKSPGVVAIGETGLDYHLPRKEQHRIRQKLWFLYQMKLAKRRSLPLILHIREADKSAVRMLKRAAPFPRGGVCHCFNGTAEQAKIYTSLGFMLGVGGSLLANTPRRRDLEQAVVRTPLESLLLETDGPFVKPDCPGLTKKQLRKARNTSLILPAVAKRVAELKGLTEEEVLRATSENAIRLFGLAIRPENEKDR